MFVVIRFLPACIGIALTAAFAYQARHAETYPFTALFGAAAFIAGGCIIAWSRHRRIADARPIIPGVLTVFALGFGLILAEGTLATVVVPLIAGGASFLVLELLFLSLYAPARYPVNGLSHVSLSLVPIALWFVSYAALGLTVFLHVTRIVPIAVLGLTAFILFAATAHAEASAASRRRWSLIGGWLGVQLGILIVALPLDLIASSTFVALAGAYVLRTRRYGIPPFVPRRQVVGEAVTFLSLITVILATARWM